MKLITISRGGQEVFNSAKTGRAIKGATLSTLNFVDNVNINQVRHGVANAASNIADSKAAKAVASKANQGISKARQGLAKGLSFLSSKINVAATKLTTVTAQ